MSHLTNFPNSTFSSSDRFAFRNVVPCSSKPPPSTHAGKGGGFGNLWMFLILAFGGFILFVALLSCALSVYAIYKNGKQCSCNNACSYNAPPPIPICTPVPCTPAPLPEPLPPCLPVPCPPVRCRVC